MREDIEEVLASAGEMLKRLIQAEARAKQLGDAHGLSRTDAQIGLGQLRVALDYLAVDVDRVLYGGANSARVRVNRDALYFPFGDDQGVTNRLKKMYQDLDVVAPVLYHLFFSVQKSRAGSDWLEILCRLNNRNKHAELGKHERTGGSETFAVGQMLALPKNLGGARIQMAGNTFNGRPIEPPGRTILLTGELTHERLAAQFPHLTIRHHKTGETFMLAGTNWEVVKLLQVAYNAVRKLADSMMSELNI